LKAATSATRFHFVGGKGGVGKTTCAAAFAVRAAAQSRVLVASLDPAHSLADALGSPLGPVPKRIPLPNGRLSAVEIDAGLALEGWLADRRATLEQLAVEGTWLDRDDVRRLLELSLPGIDEIAALLEIARLAADSRFDLVVVDTAPTGHTLRLLGLPSTLGDIAAVFEQMREKSRVMQAALTGAWRPDAQDALVDELARTASDIGALLRDTARTRMSWVTLPEPMAIAETRDALEALGSRGITVDTLIVNRVTPAPAKPCHYCDARRAAEARALEELPPAADVPHVAARDVEPRGVRGLGGIAADLRRPAPALAAPRRRPRWSAAPPGTAVRPAELLPAPLRLVLFGGKGGVGKTTCAAAVALDAAGRRPQSRVLLISTDPAHSLADVLGTAVSDRAEPVPGGPSNLEVRELDPARTLARLRTNYAEAVDRVFDRMSAGSRFDAAQDRSVMQGLIELAPPGLDELAAVLEITDALDASPRQWDLVIMDTAPTGHALRLLEMPALIHEWVRTLMSILLKYQAAGGVHAFGEQLLRLSKGMGRLRALLTDPAQAAFIVVTRAASLPRLESERLLQRLAAIGISIPVVVINAVGRGDCNRCVRIARAERAEIARILRLPAPRIALAGASLPPPLGVASVRRWARSAWRDAPRYHQDR
jgi:arsenite-transporting ATPase